MESLQNALVYTRFLAAATDPLQIVCRTFWARPLVGTDGLKTTTFNFPTRAYSQGPLSVGELVELLLPVFSADAGSVPMQQLGGRTYTEIDAAILAALQQMARCFAGPVTIASVSLRWQQGVQVLARCA